MSGKTRGGHITVVSKTIWSVDHGGNLVDVPAKLLKLIEGQPFMKLAATNHASLRIVTGSFGGNLPHNATLANNTGLKHLKELRNVASGLVVIQPADILMDDDSDKDEELPAKQPVKRRKIGPVPATHCPIVSFELPNYGLIKAARASKVHEDLIISMEGDVLERAFDYIKDSATEIYLQMQQKRAYQSKLSN
jgi:hypothetical protein